MVSIVFIAFNLVTTGRFFDVAVRAVELVIAAYTLARLTERARRVPAMTSDSVTGRGA
jgi:hypothetical protein